MGRGIVPLNQRLNEKTVVIETKFVTLWNSFYKNSFSCQIYYLHFYISSSPIKPVFFSNNLANTFIRTSSGDQRATDMEILAIQCDQAFGIRSEVTIPGIGMEDINTVSLQTYRRSIQQFNSEFAYNNLNDEAFCRKIGAVIDGLLTEFIMIA